jgi:peptidyl-prolyl cis-trans isomerase C
MNVQTSKLRFTILLLLSALALTACGGGGASPTPESTPTEVPTATATTEPMAVSVNGDGIPMAEFQAELARYQSAHPEATPETATQAVLDYFIDELLLARGAASQGYTVDDAALQARIDALVAQVGGAETLAAWQAQNGYDEASFRRALRRQIAAAWMRDQIIAAVPGTAEQVHVRQILLYNESDALEAMVQLRAGTDFNSLAAYYDALTQGELGWFPRGYLPEPAFEEAAFALQPGQYSDIIHTEAGYHIIMVIERDPAHPLSPDALLTLQYRALEDWLSQQRQQGTIILAP